MMLHQELGHFLNQWFKIYFTLEQKSKQLWTASWWVHKILLEVWWQNEHKNAFSSNHLNNCPEDCRDVSDEQGERFQDDIKAIGERYQGRWDNRMTADYSQSLKREKPQQNYSRKSR